MALLLPVLFLAGLITAFGLVGYGFGTLGRVGVRRTSRDVWLRCLAALLGAAAIVVYAWGLLLVAGAVIDAEDGGTDSAPLRPCRTSGEEDRAESVVDYTVDYVPLKFVCETEDGGSYAAESVPGSVNAVVLGFALGAVVCGGAAAVMSERRARRGDLPAV